MKIKLIPIILFTMSVALFAKSSHSDNVPPPEAKIYRDFTNQIRSSSVFSIAMPGNDNAQFSYAFQMGAPIFHDPIAYDFYMDPDDKNKIRHFWDKVSLKDGSAITIGSRSIPLTCIYISGEDNRFSGKTTPLLPDYVLKVYLVANDFTCTGPINPGWPGNGQKEEAWDTYIYFEVRDPTIMLPTETKLRYRWNDYQAFLVDQGVHSL